MRLQNAPLPHTSLPPPQQPLPIYIRSNAQIHRKYPCVSSAKQDSMKFYYCLWIFIQFPQLHLHSCSKSWAYPREESCSYLSLYSLANFAHSLISIRISTPATTPRTSTTLTSTLSPHFQLILIIYLGGPLYKPNSRTTIRPKYSFFFNGFFYLHKHYNHPGR